MLLILTNSQDATADYLQERLQQSSVDFVRIDTDTFVGNGELQFSGGQSTVRVAGRAFSPEDFDSVWYRRPESLHHSEWNRTTEGKYTLEEWSAALEAFLAFVPAPRWVNHPAANAKASIKMHQLATARQCGLRTPETLVSQSPDHVRAFADRFERIIVKPIGHGYVTCDSGTDSLIYTNPVEPITLDALDDLRNCPTLFQERVDKATDVRITVIDTAIHAVEMSARDADGDQRCDVRRNNMADVRYRSIALPECVADAITDLMRRYALRFAAIDMAIAKDGDWWFFEINPNGQWAWLDLNGGMDVAASFVDAFSRKAADSV